MALNLNSSLNLNSGSINFNQTPRTSVVYDSGLTFSASVDNVELLGNIFSVTSSAITLDTADTTFDRVDAIVAELSSSIVSGSGSATPKIINITGTASADPSFPILDVSTQIPLKYVKVKANAVTPSSVGVDAFDQETPEDFETVLIYNEGTGLPGEWDYPNNLNRLWLTNTGNTFQSTEEAYEGTYSIKNDLRPYDITGVTRKFTTFVLNYPISEGNQIANNRVAGISFYIKLKTALTTSEPVFFGGLTFQNSRTGRKSSRSLPSYTPTFVNFGIDINNTTDWQYVPLSINDFNFSTSTINPTDVITGISLGARTVSSILPNDAFVYFDKIQLHLGSLPATDPNNDGTGGNNTGGNNTGGNGTGVYKQGDTNFSIIPTNALSCVTSDFSTIGGGQNNTITASQYSYIGAGQNNILASGSNYSSILGGSYNTASGEFAFIGSGKDNVNFGELSVIGGGLRSCIIKPDGTEGANSSVIGGGIDNFIFSDANTGGHFMGAGGCNIIQTTNGQYGNRNVIVGGSNNTITGSGDVGTYSTSRNFIGAGQCNTISGSSLESAILAGENNFINNHSCSFIIGSNIESTADCTTFMNNLDVEGTVSASIFSGSFVGDGSNLTGISGGGGSDSDWFDGTTYISSSVEIRVDGTISGSSNAVIGPGHTNEGTNSVIVGGQNSTILSSVSCAAIVGGNANCVAFDRGTVVGGNSNTVKQTSGTIIGGFQNINNSGVSVIIGGQLNCLQTRNGGDASGYSSILGGLFNCILTPSQDPNNNCPIWGQVIGGGLQNKIETATCISQYNSIFAGRFNIITGSLSADVGCSFIGGGQGNTISGSSSTSAIIGGCGNTITDNENTFIVGSDICSNAACTTFVNNLTAKGTSGGNSVIIFDNLPTSDPGVTGQLWNDGGVLKIS